MMDVAGVQVRWIASGWLRLSWEASRIPGVSTLPLTSELSYFEFLANREIHNYNTRYKDNLRPPKVLRNWGKQRLAYQAITDWNNLDRKIKLSTSISTFNNFL
jgi:hypothetical protein